MGRREDLEQNIRESYDIIRGCEANIRSSDRPDEKARNRRVVREQRALIEEYEAELRDLGIHGRTGVGTGESSAQALSGPAIGASTPGQAEMLHWAFAAGFFGLQLTSELRETRAGNATIDPAGTRELMVRAYTHLGLRPSLYEEYVIRENSPVTAVQTFVRSTVSRILSETHGDRVSLMVEIGYVLGVVYGLLVYQSESGGSDGLPGALRLACDWLSDVIGYAQRAALPSAVIDTLHQARLQIEESKSLTAARSCRDILEALLGQLLATDDARQLLQGKSVD